MGAVSVRKGRRRVPSEVWSEVGVSDESQGAVRLEALQTMATSSVFSVVSVIAGESPTSDGVTVDCISREAGVSTTRVRVLLGRLNRLGMVRREWVSVGADEVACAYWLTAEGKELYEGVVEIVGS